MHTDSSLFYNRFSALYPLIDYFLRPQKKQLFKKINALPEGNLLEIGVGNGSHLGYYKKHQITGIDTSMAMLRKAHTKSFDQIRLLEMSGEQLDFENNCFDYIVVSHTIAVVSDPEKLLEESYRVLKKGGRLYLLNHFTPTNFMGVIDKGFYYFSKYFHFKSVFYFEDLNTRKLFQVREMIPFGPWNYFKLLVLEK